MAREALEASLIDGGIPAAAAKILSNAISNTNTGKTFQGRQTEDATPTQRMRLIDSDTRRYVLTNLDNNSDSPHREALSQYRMNDKRHPYEGSQPSTANPTLNTPTVKSGKYLQSNRKTDGEVAQAEVTLDIDEREGQHPRLNKETGKVESVPFSIEIEPKGILEGTVEETENGTVLKLKIVSLALREMKNKKLSYINQTNPLKVGNTGGYAQVGPGVAMVILDHDRGDSAEITNHQG